MKDKQAEEPDEANASFPIAGEDRRERMEEREEEESGAEPWWRGSVAANAKSRMMTFGSDDEDEDELRSAGAPQGSTAGLPAVDDARWLPPRLRMSDGGREGAVDSVGFRGAGTAGMTNSGVDSSGAGRKEEEGDGKSADVGGRSNSDGGRTPFAGNACGGGDVGGVCGGKAVVESGTSDGDVVRLNAASAADGGEDGGGSVGEVDRVGSRSSGRASVLLSSEVARCMAAVHVGIATQQIGRAHV